MPGMQWLWVQKVTHKAAHVLTDCLKMCCTAYAVSIGIMMERYNIKLMQVVEQGVQKSGH